MYKLNKHFKTILGIVFFCSILLLAFKEWIISSSILTSNDWTYFFKETMANTRIDYFSTWITENILGGITVDLGQAPSFVLFGIFAKYLNLNYGIIERIIY